MNAPDARRWLDSPRATVAIGIATAMLVLLVLLIAAMAFPAIISGSENARAVRRGNEVAACRAEARSAIDDANATLVTAKADLDVLTAKGLAALAGGDDAQLEALVAELPRVSAAVLDAKAAVTSATDAYRHLVDLARTDPSEFDRLCPSD